MLLPYKVRSKEILSVVDGAGNGGLIVFFEVEEETWVSSENSHLNIFRRVGGGDRNRVEMS